MKLNKANLPAQVLKARDMAIHYHGDQKYGDLPYVSHLDDVATIVQSSGEDAMTIAYLHDSLEDTNISADVIAQEFGTLISDCVVLITDPYGMNRKAKKVILLKRLSEIQDDNPMVLALEIKAADRLANMQNSYENNANLFSMYLKEYIDFKNSVLRKTNSYIFDQIDSLL